MASIKAESWDPDIINLGYIIGKDGKKIHVRKTEPRSDEFKRALEGMSKELRKRMRRLSPMQKRCIRLYYLSPEPVTQDEVAEKLKISRTALKEHLQRAIKKLKVG